MHTHAMASLGVSPCVAGPRTLPLPVPFHARQANAARLARCSAASSSSDAPKADPFATREVYSDSDPLSKFMIRYFSGVMSKQLDNKPYDGTYEGFVELSREIMRGRTSKQQQETVAGVLGSLLPPQAPERFRRWFPLNRRNAEFNAWITTLGFTWLVGPSEVMEVEVEFEGRKETWRSGVKIEKCRYLENSGCVGMVSWVTGYDPYTHLCTHHTCLLGTNRQTGTPLPPSTHLHHLCISLSTLLHSFPAHCHQTCLPCCSLCSAPTCASSPPSASSPKRLGCRSP